MHNLRTGYLENVVHLKDETHFEYIDHEVTSHINIGGELDEMYHFPSPASPKDFSRIPFPILKVGALGAYNSSGLVLAKGARLMLASSSEDYGNPMVHPQTEDYWGNVNPVGVRGVYDEAKRYAEAITIAMLKENAEMREEYSKYHKLRRDPRVTRVGRLCARPAWMSCRRSGTSYAGR